MNREELIEQAEISTEYLRRYLETLSDTELVQLITEAELVEAGLEEVQA